MGIKDNIVIGHVKDKQVILNFFTKKDAEKFMVLINDNPEITSPTKDLICKCGHHKKYHSVGSCSLFGAGK